MFPCTLRSLLAFDPAEAMLAAALCEATLATALPFSSASSRSPPFPPRLLPAWDECGGLCVPSLASEIFCAEKRFFFVVGGGGEDSKFTEVDLVGEKFATVEVEVEVGHKGRRRRWRRFGEKRKREGIASAGSIARSARGERAHGAEARRCVPMDGGEHSLDGVGGEESGWCADEGAAGKASSTHKKNPIPLLLFLSLSLSLSLSLQTILQQKLPNKSPKKTPLYDERPFELFFFFSVAVAAAAGDGWASLHKLSVCCPGLLRAGVLLEHSDFGLEREIGPDRNLLLPPHIPNPNPNPPTSTDSAAPPPNSVGWSLFDDLYLDTVYDRSESKDPSFTPPAAAAAAAAAAAPRRGDFCRKRKPQHRAGPVEAHLASGSWTLSREQGNKLLASRFRGDSLYICNWPGCIHAEEKRKYMLFRGVFKNFKRSRVWRTISDSNRGKIGLDCAFCDCKDTWDLHSAFCLRSFFGFHDDGEPVVRAFVCENGHVSGAWTERPMYT
ncbi:uncharacterized protein LOC109720039 [Ananas comosus]|uniref:Uncharacterized protein LOC109720039 n=1 Tax=Ananas comosus TaxID=4615 RepID=A0A6P5G298_ANACO|nr:uncharacterized protein LOC109720039 [Ananas comosus]